VKGYKATNKDGKCLEYQFSLPTRDEKGKWTPGEWHEHDGPVVECRSGFHFCEQPSGVFAYYSLDCRVFEIEAEGVLESPPSPGADRKRVCSRIRFTKEITPGMDAKDKGTNTGDSNTGDSNTGDSNTGWRNTGSFNTGSFNTGSRNTGDSNTGDSNTGWRNTGWRNTGSFNTGSFNTGSLNTGWRNTGDSNTGNGNCTDYQPGFFCQKEPKVQCFDKATGLTASQFREKYWRGIDRLSGDLHSGEKLNASDYDLPNITQKGLDSLVAAHAKARSSK